MDNVIVCHPRLHLTGGVAESILDSRRVVLFEVEVLGSILVNDWVNLDNCSADAMLNKRRRRGADAETTNAVMLAN